jgi:hypothetical protein
LLSSKTKTFSPILYVFSMALALYLSVDLTTDSTILIIFRINSM